MVYKIMIIEDNEKLSFHISDYLTRYGFVTCVVNDFQNIVSIFEKELPHIVLLDVNLPYYDGYYICRQLRSKTKMPIIFISARTDSMDQIMGIEVGADDYITKPINLEVLMSKIKASVRRVYGEYSNDQEKNSEIKGLSLNEATFKLSYRDHFVELTKNEFRLMKQFVEHADQILSRETLLETLWDETKFADDNSLTVNVTRLKI